MTIPVIFLCPLMVLRFCCNTTPPGVGAAILPNLRVQPQQNEGLLVGISAGADVLTSLELVGGSGKIETIVTILPDTGTRCLSLSCQSLICLTLRFFRFRTHEVRRFDEDSK